MWVCAKTERLFLRRRQMLASRYRPQGKTEHARALQGLQFPNDRADVLADVLLHERHVDAYDSARLTDFGYTLVEASLVMSMCAGFGVVGKLSFGG